MGSYEEALARAAELCGIQSEYFDIWGRRHVTSPDIQRGILESLGLACGSTDEIERAIQARLWTEWSRPLPPAIVVAEDASSISLRVPRSSAGESVKLGILWEDGELEHHWFWLPELRDLESTSLDGCEFVAKRIPLPRLRLGYHSLQVSLMTTPEQKAWATAKLIVGPSHCHAIEDRLAGLAVSLYGVRSARNWGCGDFTDLRALIDWAATELGAQFIALNPLHAIANRQPYNTSPYLPQSSFYRNLIYLDVTEAGKIDEPAEAAALRETEFVEYERVCRLKLRALKLLFRRFRQAGGSAQFDAWAAAEGELLEEFAVYLALDEAMHKRDRNVWLWTDWPARYHDPRSPEVRQFAREHWRSVMFYKWVQWHIDLQLAQAQQHAIARGMRIGLFHDLALATDRFGADLWSHRKFYIAGCRVGSPPDDFSPSGQDWSFPPPNTSAHHEDGYRLFIESIRKNARHGGALRIDHVMRFFRLYWIPDGNPASRGAYVRDHAQDLLRILALESVRGRFVVIGEDLGTVADEIREDLSRFGILSYRVFFFERNRTSAEYPVCAAVCSTTHDLPTLAGYWSGRDIEARHSAGLINEEERRRQLEDRAKAGQPMGVDEVIRFLLSTPSRLMILNQEEMTGETEQQNLPGSTWQYPNWRRKMRVTVEELSRPGPTLEFARNFRNWVRECGRLEPKTSPDS